MLRKKLITILSVAAIVLGMSSQASADPINVSLAATQTGSDASGAIYDLDFTVQFEALCVLDGSCSAAVDGLYGIDIFLDVLSVLSVDPLAGWSTIADSFAVSYFFDTYYAPLDAAGCDLDPYSASCMYAIPGDGLVPPQTIHLLMSVNVGSIVQFFDPYGFADLSFSWGFGDYTDVFVAPFGFGSSLSQCPDNFCGPAAVPEPGTLGLIGLGLFGLGAARRRRKSLTSDR